MKKNLIKMLAIFANVLIILAMTIILFIFMNKPNYTEKEMYAADVIKQGLQDNLKDPTSLRIYGEEIYLLVFDTLEMDVVSLMYDSKNGYGAYNGSQLVEVCGNWEDLYFAFNEDDEYYLDYTSLIHQLLSYDRGELENLTLDVIDAENVAKILGAEYMG